MESSDPANMNPNYTVPIDNDDFWPAAIMSNSVGEPLATELPSASPSDGSSSFESSRSSHLREQSSDSSVPGATDNGYFGESQTNQAMNDLFNFERAAKSPIERETTTPSVEHDGVTRRMAQEVEYLGGHDSAPGLRVISDFNFHNQYSSTGQGIEPFAANIPMMSQHTSNVQSAGSLPWSAPAYDAMNDPWCNRPSATHELDAPRLPLNAYEYTHGSTGKPRFTCTKLGQKSRVETQLSLKLHLHPKPSEIKKLHLQPYTLSKSKQFAKPAAQRSPDTLELFAMVVRASAMRDSSKLHKALQEARSWEPPGFPTQERRNLRNVVQDNPMNDGPVNICSSCVERECKRSQRKKNEDAELDSVWKEDVSKKVIVFNNSETLEWLPPAPGKINKPKTGENKSAKHLYEGVLLDDALFEVDLSMRICCYCRHNDEKSGFHVIFTLKDCQDQVLAQEISNPVMITDDHKDHKAGPEREKEQPENPLPLPDGQHIAKSIPQFQGDFSDSSTFRSPFSMPDIQQQLQNDFSSQNLDHQIHFGNLRGSTAKTLSRPVSPSAFFGRSKRRKASGQGPMSTDLTMANIHAPATSSNTPLKLASSNGVSLNGFSSLQTLNNSDYRNLPVTNTLPIRQETKFSMPPQPSNHLIPNVQRSEFMEDARNFPPNTIPFHTNLTTSPGMTQQQLNVTGRQHTQKFGNQLHRVTNTEPNNGLQFHHPLVITEVVPPEGPMAGGIKVAVFGSGFREDMQIVFGNQVAVTKFWSKTVLKCVLPPASKAGTVEVQPTDVYDQQLPSSAKNQTRFNYIDNEEQNLKDSVLKLVNKKIEGSDADANKSAFNINNLLFGGTLSFMGGSSQGRNGHGQSRSSNDNGTKHQDLEKTLLNCLHLVDRDDSMTRADFNLQSRTGQSMLHLSALLGYYDMVAGLLARGADADIRDNNGMSPMHMAALRNYPRIIRKLRSAGADTTLRSLTGLTAAEMTETPETFEAASSFERSLHSASVDSTHLSQSSRASSMASNRSINAYSSYNGDERNNYAEIDSDDDSFSSNQSKPTTPAKLQSLSRRESFSTDQVPLISESEGDVPPPVSYFAANAALSAWKDQVVGQISQLQNSVHKSFPTLQIPNLPPMPNLPDYQANTVVRRISSLVPQRGSQTLPSNEATAPPKEAESSWWDYWKSSPPAYEEIYPQNLQHKLDDKEAGTLLAAGEALIDQKCEATFDHVENAVPKNDSKFANSDASEAEFSENNGNFEVKKLRSDRKLFFFWIPVLTLVLVLMLKDQIPQIYDFVDQVSESLQFHQGFSYTHKCLNWAKERVWERIIDEL